MIAEMGNIRFVATVSRKSNIFIDKIFMWERGPCDKEQILLMAIKGSITMKQADFLPFLNFSMTNAIDTSASAMVEVTAATSKSKKNNIDQNRVKGIDANTSGSVIKTKVAPSKDSPLRPKLITAGNIIIPINNATAKSRAETVVAVFIRLVFLG